MEIERPSKRLLEQVFGQRVAPVGSGREQERHNGDDSHHDALHLSPPGKAAPRRRLIRYCRWPHPAAATAAASQAHRRSVRQPAPTWRGTAGRFDRATSQYRSRFPGTSGCQTDAQTDHAPPPTQTQPRAPARRDRRYQTAPIQTAHRARRNVGEAKGSSTPAPAGSSSARTITFPPLVKGGQGGGPSGIAYTNFKARRPGGLGYFSSVLCDLLLARTAGRGTMEGNVTPGPEIKLSRKATRRRGHGTTSTRHR
jgi:hypothetical protein